MPGLKFETRKGKKGVEEKPSKEDEDHQKITMIRQFSTFKKKVLNRGDSFHIKEESTSSQREYFSSLGMMCFCLTCTTLLPF